MTFKIGGKTITTDLIKGKYSAIVDSIKESPNVTLNNGVSLQAVDIEYRLQIGTSYLMKDKKYILTKKKGSELRTLVEELLPGMNFEEEIDLEDLVGKKCEIEVVENISKKGNKFANISKVKAVDKVA